MFKLVLLVLAFAVIVHDVQGHWGWRRYGYRRWGNRWQWRPWWPKTTTTTTTKPTSTTTKKTTTTKTTTTTKLTTTTTPNPCSIPGDPSAGRFQFQGKWYAFSTISLNHAQAQAACKAGCGNLVSINSVAEQNFIALGTAAGGDWYIGLVKQFNNWHWADGSNVLPSMFLYYFNNPTSAASCGYLNENNKWVRTSTCHVPHRFICENV